MQTVAKQSTGLRRAQAANATAPHRATVTRPCLQVCRVKKPEPWASNESESQVVKTQERKAAEQPDNGPDRNYTTPTSPNATGFDFKQALTTQVQQGHASDQGPTGTPHLGGVQVSPLLPAFTRRRELFAGRLAMLGLVAAGFWEWYLPSHPNPVQQVATALGVNSGLAATLIFGMIAANTAGALVPGSPTWAKQNQEDVNRRPSPPADQSVSIFKRLGITAWGWTKENEIFNGRMAMIGFLAMLLQQLRLGGVEGPGVLAQIATFLGKPTDEIFYATVPTFVAFSVFAALFSVVTGNTSAQKEKLKDFEIW